MVENQHRQITGYRDLTQEEIALINNCKAFAQQVGELVERIGAIPVSRMPPDDGVTSHDPRWLAIARTQLQQGFMALIRSIAKPTTF